MYRVTLESGLAALVGDEAHARLVTQARERGWGVTPVRRGWVVTLPSGALVAVLREGSVSRLTEVS